MRVGGGDLIDVDFRLIAATNREPEKEVEKGRFREDLYYRLKVVTLRIPPLRERVDDLPLLAEHFLEQFCGEHGRSGKRLSQEALGVLKRYPWPGNVRELRNFVESMVIFHEGSVIEAGDLPAEFRYSRSAEDEPPVQVAHGEPRRMAEIERLAILETLELTKGKRAEAARILGIGLRTLQRKLKDYQAEGHSEERGDGATVTSPDSQ